MFLSHWADLYAHPTEAEIALEPAVAALGERYRAQHPIFALGIIVDFALLDRKTVVEVDGASHSGLRAKIKDLSRTLRLHGLGWRVVRIWNAEAVANPEAALARALATPAESKESLENRLAALERVVQRSPEPKSRRKSRKPRKLKETTPEP